MFNFSYDHNDYFLFLKDLSRRIGVEASDGVLRFPPGFADGYFCVYDLPNGLQVLQMDAVLHHDFFLERLKSKEEFYTLRFDEITISDKITIKVDDESVSDDSHKRAAAILSSSLFGFSYLGTIGTGVRGIYVLLTPAWLAKYLDISSSDAVLQKYLNMKAATINIEPFDAVFRQNMGDVIDQIRNDDPMVILKKQNRIMMMIEHFFTRLHDKMSRLKDDILISNEEMHRLMDTESLLVGDLSAPAPTVSQLARHAAMSETKFKNLFKKIYGSGPYEYYQKSRMMRAHQLLLTHQFSVKEIGRQLGYVNPGNFTIAYKKEFGRLPKEV